MNDDVEDINILFLTIFPFSHSTIIVAIIIIIITIIVIIMFIRRRKNTPTVPNVVVLFFFHCIFILPHPLFFSSPSSALSLSLSLLPHSSHDMSAHRSNEPADFW